MITLLSWHWRFAPARRRKTASVGLVRLIRTTSMPRAGAARAADVEVQVAARVVRHAGRRVRAAAGRAPAVVAGAQPSAACGRTTGLPGRRCSQMWMPSKPVAGDRIAHAGRVRVRAGRLDESHVRTRMLPWTTTSPWPERVAAGLGVVELGRVLRIGDVEHAEAAPVALEREVALERDVGVDVGEAGPRAQRRGASASSRAASCSGCARTTSTRRPDRIAPLRRPRSWRCSRAPCTRPRPARSPESLFIVGSEPAHAAALLFADRNVAVDSDQFMAQGCAWAADGSSAATARALRRPRPARRTCLPSCHAILGCAHDKRVLRGSGRSVE